MRFSQILIIAFLIAGLSLTIWGLSAVEAAPLLQGPEARPSLGNGAALWVENCTPCHGIAGRGDGETAVASGLTPADFTNVEAARQRSLTAIFEVTKNGRIDRLMPPWGNQLSDQEIWDVAAYVSTLANPAAERKLGAEVYAQTCAACHGETGQGDGPQAEGAVPDLTDLAVMADKSQATWRSSLEATMEDVHAVAAGLSEDEVWQALAYARSLSFEIPARDGVLTGQVINATSGQAQGTIPITLHVLRGQSEVETLTAQADADGIFTFSDLDTDHSLFYVVEANYNNVAYFQDDVAVFAPDNREISVDLNVYETTESDEAISVKQFHQILSFTPEALAVLQVYVFGNDSDRTFAGSLGADGLPATVRIGVPPQALQVSFPEAKQLTGFRQIDDVYVGQVPISGGGGQLQVVVSYVVPRAGDTLTVAVPALYDTDTLTVLVDDQGATLDSEQLAFAERRTVQGGTFEVYRGDRLEAGQSLTLRFSDLNDLVFSASPETPTQATASTLEQSTLLWSILALGFLVLLFSIFYPRLRSPHLGQTVPLRNDLISERERLLFALFQLDETSDRGELGIDIYQQARSRYIARLRTVIQQLRAMEASD